RGAPAPVTRAVRWAGKGWIVVVSRVMSGSPYVRCAGTAAAREVSADDEVEDEQQGDRGCPHDGGHAAVRLQGGCAVEPHEAGDDTEVAVVEVAAYFVAGHAGHQGDQGGQSDCGHHGSGDRGGGNHRDGPVPLGDTDVRGVQEGKQEGGQGEPADRLGEGI